MLKIDDIEVVIDKQDSAQEHMPLAIVRLRIPVEFKDSKFYLVSRGWCVRRSEKGLDDGIRGKAFVSAPSQKSKDNRWFPTMLCENLAGVIDKVSFKALSERILKAYYKKIGAL